MTTGPIDNTANVLDSRDIIERIEYLESITLAYSVTEDGGQTLEIPNPSPAAQVNSPESTELYALLDLQAEGETYSTDWSYGETLIRRSYWGEYCKELLTDCGYIPKDLPDWIEIDYESTAKNMEADYGSVYFDGVEYLIREC